MINTVYGLAEVHSLSITQDGVEVVYRQQSDVVFTSLPPRRPADSP